jgi:hypothetical protein
MLQVDAVDEDPEKPFGISCLVSLFATMHAKTTTTMVMIVLQRQYRQWQELMCVMIAALLALLG